MFDKFRMPKLDKIQVKFWKSALSKEKNGCEIPKIAKGTESLII